MPCLPFVICFISSLGPGFYWLECPVVPFWMLTRASSIKTLGLPPTSLFHFLCREQLPSPLFPHPNEGIYVHDLTVLFSICLLSLSSKAGLRTVTEGAVCPSPVCPLGCCILVFSFPRLPFVSNSLELFPSRFHWDAVIGWDGFALPRCIYFAFPLFILAFPRFPHVSPILLSPFSFSLIFCSLCVLGCCDGR